jgi:hypothetical protein
MTSHRSAAVWVFKAFLLILALCIFAPRAAAVDLSTASPQELLRVYGQLRQLVPGDQWAVAENVAWKRDAATFTFQDGRLTFAAPVEGHVLGAVFEGRGTFELDPPTPIEQRQIARFAGSPRLQDSFRSATFFFTDDSWEQLQKLVLIRSGGANPGAADRLASAQKRYSEDFNGWIDNQRKGNFVMRNLAARMLADLADPSSRGSFLADFKGEHSGDLLLEISWNRDSFLLPELSNDEEVMLLHYNPNNYYEWWAGFHLQTEYVHTLRPEHRMVLAHCRQERIDAEVSKSNHLSATAELQYEVMQGRPRLLPLSLNGVLRIASVENGKGDKLAFIQEGRKLDSDPWVILAEPGSLGAVQTLRIAYEEDSTSDSRIIHRKGAGLYYVTARESWFPSFGAFDDRTQFQLHFRSPKKFTFVGTGRLTKAEEEKDFEETVWESQIPYSVVGFNYGDFVSKSQSDAKLTVTAYSGKEVPDELRAVESAIDTAELRAGPGHGDFASKLGLMTGGFDTRGMVGYAAGVSFQALKLFEYYYGLLPFKTVSVTEQPVRGYGQSWPTLIFLPYDSLLDSTTRQSLHLQDSGEAREFYNLVAIHEMAHQWWGHLVGWKTYHDQWLSEGFAEFSAALYLKQFEPKKWDSFWELKRKWLLSKNRAGYRPVDVGPLWLNEQLNEQVESNNAMYLTYFKGAYILEMLRVLMEDPSSKVPDARFIGMMRDLTSTYAGKNASTEDFRRIVEKHISEPMDWSFNEWVYGTEVPHYDFKYQITPGEGGKTVLHISLTQSEVSDSFEMRVPFYATVNGQARRLGFIKIRGASTFSGQLALAFRPEKVTLDEFHSILCTIRQ